MISKELEGTLNAALDAQCRQIDISIDRVLFSVSLSTLRATHNLDGLRWGHNPGGLRGEYLQWQQ